MTLIKTNLKRKVFARGKQNFKRFKRLPKYAKDNLENKIAREVQKDPYLFTDSENDDRADDLGMGLELSDLPILDENFEKSQQSIALTQDSVRPFFADEASYDETKLNDALVELKHSSFRPNQKEAIKRVLFGRSTLFISSTGSGKSLCYQLPALLYSRFRNYMTIVVSPLISLMEDQIATLPKCLKAVCLHSNQSAVQKRQSISQLVNHEAQIVFISPEAIVGGLLNVEDLKNLPPVGFVCIDEAHCLSEWSHNFRPAYLQFINILTEKMNIKTFLALTATATKKTSFAISRQLVINPEYDVIGSTTIPDNLILSVSYEKDKQKALLELLKSRTFRIMPSIIIYCNRQEDTERVATDIRTAMQAYSSTADAPRLIKSGEEDSPERPREKMTLSWHAEAYHAGIGKDARRQIQKRFIKGEIRVVVATVAFGMGINKSNIRAVIHYDMPDSFERYVQEIGRAGRDGQVAQCHMFLRSDRSDLHYQQRNIYKSIVPKRNLIKLVHHIFKQNCKDSPSDEELERLQRLNNLDPPNQSVIKKHRACKGHEHTFSIDEAVNDINLWPESIMTIMCKIQQAYPHLLIKQLPTCRANCIVSCKTPEHMKRLKEVSEPIKIGSIVTKAPNSKAEMSRRINFDIVRVANFLRKSSQEVMRMVNMLEWELVESTGQFRRSQVRVRFEGNYFHLVSVTDLSNEEMKEIEKFVVESNHQYELKERERMARVYDIFKNFSIPIHKMTDKDARLDLNDRLKAALNNYFDPTFLASQVQSSNENTEVPSTVINSIRKTASEFISAHGKEGYTPAAIAKIFQGISTPNHPAEIWGPNRKWWRQHVDVDFRVLCDSIRDLVV